MAESVDALVSNTSGATRAGSTPALGTGFEAKVLQDLSSQHLFCVYINYKREERNCPVQDSPSLSYTLKYKRILFYLLISETALVALVLTTEASDKTTKLKIIIIKPFLNF